MDKIAWWYGKFADNELKAVEKHICKLLLQGYTTNKVVSFWWYTENLSLKL